MTTKHGRWSGGVRSAALALFALGLPAAAIADRLIVVPIATKLLYRMYRLEVRTDGDDKTWTHIGVGLTREIEAEFQMERLSANRWVGTLDVAYNYMVPIVDTVPGVSIGMRDLFDRTEEGRFAYLAFTQRLGLDGEFNSHTPMEVTLGAKFGRRSSPFVGVSIPFTWQFRGLAEHDGRFLRAGFEYRASTNFSLRWVTEERGPSWSLRWTARF